MTTPRSRRCPVAGAGPRSSTLGGTVLRRGCRWGCGTGAGQGHLETEMLFFAIGQSLCDANPIDITGLADTDT